MCSKPISSCYLYNYSKIDQDHFTFSCPPWHLIDYNSDIEISNWAMWKDLFLSAVDESVPKLLWKQRKVKHWLVMIPSLLFTKNGNFTKI